MLKRVFEYSSAQIEANSEKKLVNEVDVEDLSFRIFAAKICLNTVLNTSNLFGIYEAYIHLFEYSTSMAGFDYGSDDPIKGLFDKEVSQNYMGFICEMLFTKDMLVRICIKLLQTKKYEGTVAAFILLHTFLNHEYDTVINSHKPLVTNYSDLVEDDEED